MPCYNPIPAYRSRFSNSNGNSPIVFSHRDSNGIRLKVRCRGCIGCRQRRARDLKILGYCESMMHDELMFITLTWDPNHPDFPHAGSIAKPHVQKFLKRLRFKFPGRKIYYYACGEYGEAGPGHHPHYHLIIFGLWFSDAYKWRQSKGHWCYRSPTLEKLWKFGNSEFGSVTKDSIGYVAGYVHKKITGDMAEDHYLVEHLGEAVQVEPEFFLSSSHPAVGRRHFDKYWKHIYTWDSVVMDGKEYSPPEYFDILLAKEHPEEWERVCKERRRRAMKADARKDSTPARLHVREKVATIRLERKKRSYESGETVSDRHI